MVSNLRVIELKFDVQVCSQKIIIRLSVYIIRLTFSEKKKTESNASLYSNILFDNGNIFVNFFFVPQCFVRNVELAIKLVRTEKE